MGIASRALALLLLPALTLSLSCDVVRDCSAPADNATLEIGRAHV